MGIQKQEFYEGAALHLLLRSGRQALLRYDHPFFIMEEKTCLYLKYSTKNRSPWGFSVNEQELQNLQRASNQYSVILGLVCGGDGVAAVTFEELQAIARDADETQHLSCYRKHKEHYEVNGPLGALSSKVPPSRWQRLLER